MPMKIRAFEESDIAKVKEFTDAQIGTNYFNFLELRQMQRQSCRLGQNASFVLLEGDEILGLRLSFPAGHWMSGKGGRLSDHLWPFSIEYTAYFQSLFLHPKIQRQGWGQKLSIKSMDVLQSLGAKGIVCHAWVESPGDSSRKYLQALGFKSLTVYPEYWKEVDYNCPRCGKPCVCSAEEMYLQIGGR